MAVSKVEKNTVVMEITGSTQSNSYVSPFGAFGEYQLSIPQGYKVSGAIIEATGTSNPVACKVTPTGWLLVYSKTAVSFIARVIFTP